MPPVKPIAWERLRPAFDPARLEWDDSSQINPHKSARGVLSVFQPRAAKALDLALRIKDSAYNVYIAGEPGLGRMELLLSLLKPRAQKMDPPPDLVYVYNFDNPNTPSLLSLPAGQGKKLKKLINELIENIEPELEKILSAPHFQRERARILESFSAKKSGALAAMRSMASENGLSLDFDNEEGIILTPYADDIKRDAGGSGPAAEVQNPQSKKINSQAARNLFLHALSLNKIDDLRHQKESELERAAMEEALARLFPALEKKLLAKTANPKLETYLNALKKDLLNNSAFFLAGNDPVKGGERAGLAPPRYAVNVFVDNSETRGAPVIVEDNPASCNLLGCMEREGEMGALVADFTLIRAGSLQKANGGFLVLHAEDILRHPLSWEALLRALGSSSIKIEDSPELPDIAVRTRSLAPEPLKLNLKVILIGSDELLEDLPAYDERFARLFRARAHINDQAARNSANIKLYLLRAAQIISEAGLPVFDRGALARLVDLGSRLCEDQKKLSLKFPQIRSYMMEAAALAQSQGQDIVSGEILDKACAERDFRENLTEEAFLEEYGRQIIKLETSGQAVGQANGLSVIMSGDYEFGLPHRISCAVGVGNDGIIDLEREADLGGPIHTKAMLILKGYLTRMFAKKKPLILNASLYFEQSYAGVEGDSASGAELAALLSAIAEAPIRLDLAFTGALGHSGRIMAVGGVTKKIEGFYKICAQKGLTGTQGVIIPYDNADHLTLSSEIQESVKNNKFFIYPARNIEEALELLTGLPAGRAHKDGSFTKGSLFDLVDRRLERLGFSAQRAFHRPRKDPA